MQSEPGDLGNNPVIVIIKDYVERYQNIIIELEDLKKAYLDNRLFIT